MAHKYHKSVPVMANGSTLICLAAMLLILPLQWIGAALLAALVHELFHVGAVRLCGGRVFKLRIGTNGAAMEIPPMRRPQELFCALAGPLGGLLLLPLTKWLPRTALCAAFQSLYNLLPVYPLDGGRAIRCICEMLFSPSTAQHVCVFLEYWICILLAVLAFLSVFVWHIGLLPAVAAALTIYRICITQHKSRAML